MAFNVDYVVNLRDKATAKLKALQGESEKTNKGFKVLSGMGGVGGLIAGAGIAAGIAGIAKMGIEMEQTRVAFGTFLGSGEKANALIAELNQFANVTPFDNGQIISASKALLTAGVSAEGMTDQLKTIGDVAAGAGVPITELSQIFAKATNKGKLQAEELNQFAERGIPILDVLAKKWGVNKAEVLKMGSQGKITSDIMKEAFETMSGEGGKFQDMMQKQSATTGGKISTLIGKLQMIGISIGEAVLPVISAFADFAIKIADNTALLKTMGIIIGIAVAGFVAFKTIMLISSAQTIAFTAAQWLLNAALSANPIGLVIAGIAALVAGFVLAWNNSETFRGVLLGLWEVLKLVGAALYDWFIQPMVDFWNLIKPMIPVVQNFFQGIIDFVKPVGKAIFDFLVAPIKLAIDGIKSALEWLGLMDGDSSLGKVKGAFDKGFASGKDKEEEKAAGLGQDTSALAALGADGTSTLGAVKTLKKGTGKGLSSGIDKVTSSAPKTFNINIDSLVENFQITTNNMAESADKTKDMILQTLLTAVSDVSIMDN